MKLMIDVPDELKRYADESAKGDCRFSAIAEAANGSAALLAIANSTSSGWVSCSEKLPKSHNSPSYDDGHEVLFKSDIVLIWACADGTPSYGLATFIEDRGDEKYAYWDGFVFKAEGIALYNPENVFAWMPLPEPYREAEDHEQEKEETH